MAVVQPTSIELRLPPDPQLLRVLRLVGSGLASLGHLDLAGVEEVRVAVDELASTLIAVGDGGPVELTFDLTASALCVEGATSVAASADVVIDPMTDRLLSVVATTHRWDVQDGRATGRIERTLAQPPVDADSH
jgi:hypothetical protein